jgi:putative ABC transport system substrate-binding protein
MPVGQTNRRAFMAALSGAAAWPLVASAQTAEQIRRIGVLMNFVADDPEGQARVASFVKGLNDLGWNVGHNVQIDYRWAAADAGRRHRFATELVGLGPDVILASTSPSMAALQQITRSIPIVFVQTIDPVGGGFVKSLARPGGNATGFIVFDFGISGKWLELLKDVAPRMMRVAVVRDPGSPSQIGLLGGMQSVASSAGMELYSIDARERDQIERDISEFAREAGGGLIVLSGGASLDHRHQIVTLAATHRLPAVYTDRVFVKDGGLISYDVDRADQYRRAAAYVDRILKGEKPADLPVQAPTKYELAINLKTAKALGLTVPPSLLARADEVIE